MIAEQGLGEIIKRQDYIAQFVENHDQPKPKKPAQKKKKAAAKEQVIEGLREMK